MYVNEKRYEHHESSANGGNGDVVGYVNHFSNTFLGRTNNINNKFLQFIITDRFLIGL